MTEVKSLIIENRITSHLCVLMQLCLTLQYTYSLFSLCRYGNLWEGNVYIRFLCTIAWFLRQNIGVYCIACVSANSCHFHCGLLWWKGLYSSWKVPFHVLISGCFCFSSAMHKIAASFFLLQLWGLAKTNFWYIKNTLHFPFLLYITVWGQSSHCLLSVLHIWLRTWAFCTCWLSHVLGPPKQERMLSIHQTEKGKGNTWTISKRVSGIFLTAATDFYMLVSSARIETYSITQWQDMLGENPHV